MNIQEVLKLKNGTIVQDTETKERYIVFTYGRDKYLARYKYREEILHFVECEKLYKIIVPICDKLILAEYVICPDFRERDNFIYECKNGELCKGMILKVNRYVSGAEKQSRQCRENSEILQRACRIFPC